MSQDITASLVQQYERVVFETFIKTFGLDFILVKDRRGGDVDTLHTVRDPTVTDYASSDNQAAYDNRGEYNSHEYHSHPNYIGKNRANSEALKQGNLHDAYTGEQITQKGSYDLDHTISAKEIHDDPARVLARKNGADLANTSSNLNATSASVNRSKQAMSATEYQAKITAKKKEISTEILSLKTEISVLEKSQSASESDRLTLKTKKQQLKKHEDQLKVVNSGKLQEADRQARADYEKALQDYYKSPAFMTDLGQASLTKGSQMAVRQGLGFLLSEVWMLVRVEAPRLIQRYKAHDDFSKLFSDISDLVKKSYEAVKAKYKQLLASLADGMIAGIFSTVMNTLINIFFTTAKNVGKIIRESWTSLVEALRVLLFNPDKLPFGSLVLHASKIVATGAAVVMGVLVAEAAAKHGLAAIPFVGDLLITLIGALTTGILSVSFIYFLDHSKLIQKVVAYVDGIKSKEQHALDYFLKINQEMNRYCAELMSIDYQAFEAELLKVRNINQRLACAEDDGTFSEELKKIVKEMNIQLPYSNRSELNAFMNDRSRVLVL
ncbi:MAG: hypothetical protein WA154_01555 [Moraxellaceae bacterium]